MQDELDEIKIERDGLAKKANTLDKYKQKLQSIQDLESENRQLHSEVEELRQQTREADNNREDSVGLQLMVEQYRRTISKVEQDYSDLQIVKRRLEHDKVTLVERIESLTEQQSRNVETISDLQDRVREIESGAIPGGDDGSLETELEGGEKSKADLYGRRPDARSGDADAASKLEISRLKGEIHKAKKASDGDANCVMLKNLLDDSTRKNESLQTKFLDAYQAQLILESQLSLFTKGPVPEGFDPALYELARPLTEMSDSAEPFAKIREMHTKVQEELSTARKQLAAGDAERALLKQELRAAKLDCKQLISVCTRGDADSSSVGLVDKDKMVALEELKQANSAEVDEVRRDIKETAARNNELVADLDEQKSLVSRVLLKLSDSKDKLHDTEMTSGGLKATLDALQAESRGRREGGAEVTDRRVADLQGEASATAEKLNSQIEVMTPLFKESNRLLSNMEPEPSTAGHFSWFLPRY